MLYRMTHDDNGHYYMVPFDKIEEFKAWVYYWYVSAEPLEGRPQPPVGTISLGSSFDYVIVENPRAQDGSTLPTFTINNVWEMQ